MCVEIQNQVLINEKPIGKVLSPKTTKLPMGDYMKCNWSQYNKTLENRGSINFWFSPEAIKKWRAPLKQTVGRPTVFSDDAILTLLMLKFVYRLAFRQLVGFARSLIDLLQLNLEIPHFTSIGKRMKKLTIPTHLLRKQAITDIVFDTTGLRVYSSGEWKKEKYGGKRRWRKIHVGINLHTKEIIFAKATDEHVHDLAHVSDVLACCNRKKGAFLIDGIGDTHDLYAKTALYNKKLLTPPRQNASLFSGCLSRQHAVRLISLLGNDREARAIWAKLTGYNQRAHIEGSFSIWKRMFGEELSSRTHKGIDIEVYVKSLMFNKMKSNKIQ